MPFLLSYSSGFWRYAVRPSSKETEAGDALSVASRDYQCLSIPMAACCHCAVTTPTLSSSTQVDPQSHFTCAALSRSFYKYPAQPVMLSSLLPFPSRQAEQPLLPTESPSRIAQHWGTKLKESPFKSSSCLVSSKVSLPLPR